MSAASSIAATEAASQYITFTLGSGEYGIEILSVQEFKGYTTVTLVPNMPGYLRGVMNLRGIIIPVFDLRMRFGLPAEIQPSTVIVVVVVDHRTVGLVVDSVSDVIELRSSDIQQITEVGESMQNNFLRGMARAGERLIILVDLPRIVTIERSAAPPALAHAPPG